MTEPTKEQQKEFWEWCGFKKKLVWSDPADIVPRHQFEAWEDPEGMPGLPPPNLNNLFKYAVPKGLVDDGMEINFTSPDIHRDFPRRKWKCYGRLFNYGNGFTFRGEGEDPALALFWALYQVMKKANK